MTAILLALAMAAAAAEPPPVVTLHTTFQNPVMPPYVTGYGVEVYERHDLGPRPYAQPKISQPVRLPWHWLTFEGDVWTVWTDWPQPGQVIYLCVYSWNSAGASECTHGEEGY